MVFIPEQRKIEVVSTAYAVEFLGLKSRSNLYLTKRYKQYIIKGTGKNNFFNLDQFLEDEEKRNTLIAVLDSFLLFIVDECNQQYTTLYEGHKEQANIYVTGLYMKHKVVRSFLRNNKQCFDDFVEYYLYKKKDVEYIYNLIMQEDVICQLFKWNKTICLDKFLKGDN